MAIKIAADIHGDYADIAGQLEPDDTLILCGDYVEFVDYKTLDGIFAELLPRETIARVIGAMADGRKDDAKTIVGELFVTRPNLRAEIGALVVREYARLAEAIPCTAYAIYGNTDFPDLLKRSLGDRHHVVEAEAIELDGVRFGLVSGMPPSPFTFGMSGEVDEADYVRRLDSVGAVDVLVTHPPASLTDLSYDVVADRDEEGSRAILEYLERFEPTHHYFGHVHQPRKDRLTHGPTELINVGLRLRKGKLWRHETGA